MSQDARIASLEKGQRQLVGVPGAIAAVVASLMTLYFLKLSILGEVNSELPKAVYLSATLILVFLLYPAGPRSERRKPSAVDYILAAASLIVMVYWYVEVNNYWESRPTMPTMTDLAMGTVLILLCLEMSRRVLGWALLALGAFFLLQLVFGPYLVGIFQHKGFTLTRSIEYMFFGRDAIFGSILNIFTLFVFPFIIFGAFLEKSGAGAFFIDLSCSIAGRLPGGPALMAVISSAWFGSISGSPVANAVATGTFTIPLMKRVGYSRERAAAVEAAASTGGQFMPPVMGAAAFVMATLTETSYRTIMLMALIPALLYFLYVGLSVFFYAMRHGFSGLPADEIPSLTSVLKRGWFYIGAPAILFSMILMGYSPILSAFWGTAFLVVAVAIKPELRRRFKDFFVESLTKAARDNLMVGSVVGTIGIILGGITLGGLGLRFSSLIMDLAGGDLFLSIILATLMAIVIGMGMPTTPSYILMAILVAPAFIRMGVQVLPAHFLIFWLALTSNVTPPVCVTAFAAASVAGSNPMKTGFLAMKMSICMYALPFAFVYFPQVILLGTTYEIVEVATCYTFGLLALAAFAEGWYIVRLNWLQRFLFLGAAMMLFDPGLITDVVGLSFLLIATILFMRARQQKKAAVAAES